MAEDAAHCRAQAERFHQLARLVADHQMADWLKELAATFLERAFVIEAGTGRTIPPESPLIHT
jgi:hypothetical protein